MGRLFLEFFKGAAGDIRQTHAQSFSNGCLVNNRTIFDNLELQLHLDPHQTCLMIKMATSIIGSMRNCSATVFNLNLERRPQGTEGFFKGLLSAKSGHHFNNGLGRDCRVLPINNFPAAIEMFNQG
jgi:hypothetical protein